MNEFEQLLDFRQLSAHWMGLPGISEYLFTGEFFDSIPKQDINTDDMEWIAISAIQTPGPANKRDGSAKVVGGNGGTRRYLTGFRYFIERPLQGDALKALREFDSPGMQSKGMQLVELALAEENIRWRLFKEVVISYIMHTGRVNFGLDGNILHPTVNSTTGAITNHASAVVSADFGVADSHRGNLGGVISALWSVAGTKILTQLETLRRTSGTLGVPKPRRIFINALDKQYLRQNDEFVEWAVAGSSRSQQAAVDAVLTGDMIKDLWGFEWHFVDGTWVDAGGTTRDLIPRGRALIQPEKGSWLKAVNGTEIVPTSVGLVGGLREALASTKEVAGPFAYGKLVDNPVRLSQFMGDNFGVGFADPNAVWMPTVFPES